MQLEASSVVVVVGGGGGGGDIDGDDYDTDV